MVHICTYIYIYSYKLSRDMKYYSIVIVPILPFNGYHSQGPWLSHQDRGYESPVGIGTSDSCSSVSVISDTIYIGLVTTPAC